MVQSLTQAQTEPRSSNRSSRSNNREAVRPAVGRGSADDARCVAKARAKAGGNVLIGRLLSHVQLAFLLVVLIHLYRQLKVIVLVIDGLEKVGVIDHFSFLTAIDDQDLVARIAE